MGREDWGDSLLDARQGGVVEGVDMATLELGRQDGGFGVPLWCKGGVAVTLQDLVDVVLRFAVADEEEVERPSCQRGRGVFWGRHGSAM